MRGHSTEQEMKLIDGLGTYNNEHKMSVVEVLKGYLNGSAKRTNWAEIDKRKVIDYATKRLDSEMAVLVTNSIEGWEG